jgi:hypothetical protein
VSATAWLAQLGAAILTVIALFIQGRRRGWI